MTKDKLTELGWTKAKLLLRMASCRENAKTFRSYPENSKFSYRFLNQNLYLKYKNWLKILEN